MGVNIYDGFNSCIHTTSATTLVLGSSVERLQKKPNQDRKFRGQGKTVTTVRSLDYLDFQIFEDRERPVYLSSTSLSTFEIQAFLVHNIILVCYILPDTR